MLGTAGISSLLLSDWRRSLTELQSQACEVLWPRPSMLPLTQSSPVKEEEFCWEMSVQERRSVCLCLRSESEAPVPRSTGVSQCPVTVRSPLEYNIRPPSSHQHAEMEKFPKNISRKNRTQGVDVVPDNDDSCAGVDQNVRTDSLTPPGPQYLIIHYYSQRALIYRMWKMYTFIKVKECINM